MRSSQHPPHSAIVGTVRFSFCASLVGLLFAAVSCTRTPAPDGDHALEVMLAGEPDTVDPRYASDATSSRVSRLLHAGLFKLSPDTLLPVPNLAKTWSWQSATTLRIELGEHRFHGGQPLRCADVRATLAALKDPETRSRAGIAFRALKSVECVSERDVLIHTAAPQASLLFDLIFPILREDQAASPPSEELDGLGPYIMQRPESMLWSLRPAYPGKSGAPTRSLHLRAVGDENARALRLLSGRADVASGVMSPLLAAALQRRGLTLNETEGANLTYMVARLDQGPGASVELRRFLRTHAPRTDVISGMLAGHASLAEGILPPKVLGQSAERALPAQPSALPALRHAELLVGTDRTRVAIARAMADEWAKAGVNVDVVPLELGVLLARLGRGEFSFAMLQVPDLADPGLLRMVLHSSAAPPYGMNRSRYHNADVDAWLDAAAAELDPALRRALYAKVEAQAAIDLPMMPLWRERHIAVVSPAAQTFAPTADGQWGALCDLR